MTSALTSARAASSAATYVAQSAPFELFGCQLGRHKGLPRGEWSAALRIPGADGEDGDEDQRDAR